MQAFHMFHCIGSSEYLDERGARENQEQSPLKSLESCRCDQTLPPILAITKQ